MHIAITKIFCPAGNNSFLRQLCRLKNTYQAKRERALAPTNRGVPRKPRAISASNSIANQSLQSKIYPALA